MGSGMRCTNGPAVFGAFVSSSKLSTKRLNRTSDVLEIERAKLLENKVASIAQMLPHRSRDADAARWAFRLEPRGHIHHVAMHISAIWNHIADVDADAKSDRPIGRLVAI